MQAIKKIYIDDNMTTFLHSILQQNKFNSINIKFKFRILEALLMDDNMDSINTEKIDYFWQLWKI